MEKSVISNERDFMKSLIIRNALLDSSMDQIQHEFNQKVEACKVLEHELDKYIKLSDRLSGELEALNLRKKKSLENVEGLKRGIAALRSLDQSLCIQIQNIRAENDELRHEQKIMLDKYNNIWKNYKVQYVRLPWIQDLEQIELETRQVDIEIKVCKRKIFEEDRKIVLFKKISCQRKQSAIIELAKICVDLEKLNNTCQDNQELKKKLEENINHLKETKRQKMEELAEYTKSNINLLKHKQDMHLKHQPEKDYYHKEILDNEELNFLNFNIKSRSSLDNSVLSSDNSNIFQLPGLPQSLKNLVLIGSESTYSQNSMEETSQRNSQENGSNSNTNSHLICSDTFLNSWKDDNSHNLPSSNNNSNIINDVLTSKSNKTIRMFESNIGPENDSCLSEQNISPLIRRENHQQQDKNEPQKNTDNKRNKDHSNLHDTSTESRALMKGVLSKNTCNSTPNYVMEVDVNMTDIYQDNHTERYLSGELNYNKYIASGEEDSNRNKNNKSEGIIEKHDRIESQKDRNQYWDGNYTRSQQIEEQYTSQGRQTEFEQREKSMKTPERYSASHCKEVERFDESSLREVIENPQLNSASQINSSSESIYESGIQGSIGLQRGELPEGQNVSLSPNTFKKPSFTINRSIPSALKVKGSPKQKRVKFLDWEESNVYKSPPYSQDIFLQDSGFSGSQESMEMEDRASPKEHNTSFETLQNKERSNISPKNILKKIPFQDDENLLVRTHRDSKINSESMDCPSTSIQSENRGRMISHFLPSPVRSSAMQFRESEEHIASKSLTSPRPEAASTPYNQSPYIMSPKSSSSNIKIPQVLDDVTTPMFDFGTASSILSPVRQNPSFLQFEKTAVPEGNEAFNFFGSNEDSENETNVTTNFFNLF